MWVGFNASYLHLCQRQFDASLITQLTSNSICDIVVLRFSFLSPGEVTTKMSTGERYLQTKCSVNSRMPLVDRLQPIQGTSERALSEAPAPRSAFLQRRHPIESTYNASLRSAVRSASDVPTRERDNYNETVGMRAILEATASSRNAAGGSTVDGATTAVRSGGGSVVVLPVSSQRGEYNAGSRFIPAEQLTFYSTVRKEEQPHESSKGGQLQILAKRQTAPEYQPPQQDWSPLLETMSSRRSAAGSGWAGAKSTDSSVRLVNGVVVHHEDDVKNYRPPYRTAYQTEFRSTQTLLPVSLDGSFSTQRAALSFHSSSRDLFKGTPKSVPPRALPNFVGHVPHHERNLAQIKGDGVEILRPHSKCTVNLASSKGVDSGARGRSEVRSAASLGSTVMGFYTQQAVNASATEKAMNRRVV
ncbi:Hypothetical protein, putative [Bodo saltans]|uniref:Uncharacterized protein n=1 Tax=Bodo saltans TaxID=75058 RepID=A0A0S4JBY8_BODSA|nr:Hypothetical protein, putative [Bodo saltans]|eukprot:CUG87690.1 Hypothetical protein, putative [Bodo saltans]